MKLNFTVLIAILLILQVSAVAGNAKGADTVTLAKCPEIANPIEFFKDRCVGSIEYAAFTAGSSAQAVEAKARDFCECVGDKVVVENAASLSCTRIGLSSPKNMPLFLRESIVRAKCGSVPR